MGYLTDEVIIRELKATLERLANPAPMTDIITFNGQPYHSEYMDNRNRIAFAQKCLKEYG